MRERLSLSVYEAATVDTRIKVRQRKLSTAVILRAHRWQLCAVWSSELILPAVSHVDATPCPPFSVFQTSVRLLLACNPHSYRKHSSLACNADQHSSGNNSKPVIVCVVRKSVFFLWAGRETWWLSSGGADYACISMNVRWGTVCVWCDDLFRLNAPEWRNCG